MAKADVYLERPSNPSTDLKAFRKQFIFHNINKTVNKLKEADYTTKTLLATSKDINNPVTSIKGPDFSFNTGANIQKGKVFLKLNYLDYNVSSDIDLINRSYGINLKYYFINTYYSKTLSKPNYFGIAFSRAIE